ncbi:ornithine decarboxylase [Fusarium heterosporum]|uniref:Ornithine decarboxylase n=1 Tax=Fusarium heterosporum TaxID=42747 RepID=A0A8H5SVB9_FUSHE|nr:ornithine decarboxylase [Fusarium heterosporum]
MAAATSICYPSKMSLSIQNALKRHNAQSLEERERPIIVIDILTVKDIIRKFIASWPSNRRIEVMVFAAVKVCSDEPAIDAFDDLGCNFDCASKGEAKPLVDRGVSPARISLGNCNLSNGDILWGIKTGIQYYAVDSATQIDRIVHAATEVAVPQGVTSATTLAQLKSFCRLVSSGKGSEKPFSTRFGVDPEQAFALIKKAHGHGLTFVGLSGHPGTQNLDKNTFIQFSTMFYGVFDHVQTELGIAPLIS